MVNYVASNRVTDTIYEDKYLIVIEKPSGLLTIGTIKERENEK